MDDSALKCNPFNACDMEKQQFADPEKVEELIPDSEEEEILSSKEVALEILVVNLNWTLFSAMITGSIWWMQFNAQRPNPPGNADVPTHDRQMSPLRYTLSNGVLFAGSSLSFCIALLIVLGKIAMRQHTLTLRLPPFGPRRLPRHKAQYIRAIPTSIPTWFMQLLKSLQFIFPLIQVVLTMALLAFFWFL